MSETVSKLHLSALDHPLSLPGHMIQANWTGPCSLDPAGLEERITQALDQPTEYPGVRHIVVPGDRVLLLVDPRTPSWSLVVEAILERLSSASVLLEDISLMVPFGSEIPAESSLPKEIRWLTHTPGDKAEIAYLCSTKAERRVYLNRHIVEADVVIPVGWLRPGESFGLRGPWSTVFPDSSDEPTLREFSLVQPDLDEDAPGPASATKSVMESAEVSWLLGARLQVAVLPGATGVADVLCGDVEKLATECEQRFAERWTFRAEEKAADLVILSVGDAQTPGGWEEITRAIASARPLVARGGRMVIISQTNQRPGPALKSLGEVEDSEDLVAAIEQFEDHTDFVPAMRLARLDRSLPIGLLSSLPDSEVEDIGFVALRDAGEVEKMALKARRVCVINRAEFTIVEVEN